MSDIDVADPRNFLDISEIYLRTKVELLLASEKMNNTDVKNFKLNCLSFYVELAVQIKRRFKFNDQLLKFMTNLHPRKVVSGEIQSIAGINAFFPQLVDDLESLNTEFRMLADIDEIRKYSCKLFDEFWSHVFNIRNELNEYMFPNVTKLVKSLMCLPHSSAAAERVFSQLNLIKTKVRNRLEIKTCDAILLLPGNQTLVF